MIARVDYRIVDLAFFLIANLVNILMLGIFLSRPKGAERLEFVLGLILIALALPTGIGIILNIAGKREWWTIVLPSLLVAFLIIELVLDYILRSDFRNTFLLWPYLLVYYLALMGMIGYAFLIGRRYGFITLATYFLNLLATWYSYSRAGHG
jgi:hypothetical protein